MSSATSSLGRGFDRFLVASAVSNLGDGVRFGALPLLALSLTDDARLISLVVAATMLPWLVLGPMGGAIVDRADRRHLIITAQLFRAALVGVLIIGIATDAANIWCLVMIAFGLGAGEILVDTSSQAAVPMLVEENMLDRANGRLIAAITLFDNVVGVALGSLLFAVFTELPIHRGLRNVRDWSCPRGCHPTTAARRPHGNGADLGSRRHRRRRTFPVHAPPSARNDGWGHPVERRWCCRVRRVRGVGRRRNRRS